MTEGNREVEDLPKGWATCELQSLCELITKGSTPTTYGHQYKAQGINFVKTENINNNGFIFNIKQFIDEEANDFLKRSQLNVGDILFSIAGTIGRIGIVREKDFPANTNQALSIIRLIKNTISDKYLFYFLKSPLVQKNILKSIAGVGRANLSLKDIGELNILLSPLPEQNRIVEKIEELFSDVDQGIESLKTAQKQLKAYRQAVLKWAFEGKLTEAWRKQHSSTLKTGEALLAQIKAERETRYQQQLAEWETAVEEWEAIGKVGKKPNKPRKLGAIPAFTKEELAKLPKLPEGWAWARIDEIGDVQLGRQRAPKHHVGEHMRPYLRVANVFENRIDVSDVLEMNFTPQEYKIYELKYGDILLNEGQSLELVGRSAIYKNEIPGACFQNTLVRFKPSPLLSSAFPQGIFLHYFHSGRFQKIAKWTTSMAHLGGFCITPRKGIFHNETYESYVSGNRINC